LTITSAASNGIATEKAMTETFAVESSNAAARKGCTTTTAIPIDSPPNNVGPWPASLGGTTIEQGVFDGVRWNAGPHVAGWVERATPYGMVIRLLSTGAGKTARALLEEELLDFVLSRDFPPVISSQQAREVFD
jgi:hypothetical protein